MGCIGNRVSSSENNLTATAQSVASPSVVSTEACASNLPGPRIIRRLSSAQFNNSIRDVFNDSNAPNAEFFSDPIVSGMSADAQALLFEGPMSTQMMLFAEQTATWAVANHLAQLTSCTTMDSNCRNAFIQQFGQRLFRGPVSPTDAVAYASIFAAESTFNDAATATISAMLQSPYFIYRTELGTPSPSNAALYTLTPFEIATALSYLLVGTTPDDTLLSVAATGQLSNPLQIDAQAQRLMQDPRSRAATSEFIVEWLGINGILTVARDDTVMPLTGTLRQEMLTESRAFAAHVVLDANGSLGDLFTANYSYLNPDLIQYYGLTGASGQGTSSPLDANFLQTPYTGTHRDGGILAHGALLTVYADASYDSPVQRGKMVRTRLLCQTIPPPPPNVRTTLTSSATIVTTRQRFAAHDTNASCASCHTLMDPVGFGFENYDEFGRYRTQENGVDVDSSGTIMGTSQGDLKFSGVMGLASYLSNSDQVQQCMVQFWSYYAYGLSSWNQAQCTYQAIDKDAKSNGNTLKSVLQGIIHAPNFTTRVGD